VSEFVCLKLEPPLSNQNTSSRHHLGASARMGTDIADYLEHYDVTFVIELDDVFKGSSDI
jgi:hypothetical protein